jgi:CRP/FNR family transcriptional regulator, cyclic AMP receptor protein
VSGSDTPEAAVRAALGEAPILRSAPSTALDDLVRAGGVRTFRRGTYLFHQGAASDEVYCLIGGRLEISSHAPSGHRKLHAVVSVPQLIGELGILGDSPRTATVLAVDDSTVWVVTAERFLAFLEGTFDATRELLRVLAAQIQSHEAFAEDLLHLDLKGRVAKRLLQLAGQDSADDPPGDGAMAPALTHGDLASLCGGSRENVTRTLSELERRGMVERVGRRYRIVNAAALSRLAGR